METPLMIYIKAVGLYAIITLPALFLGPIIYVISMIYVLLYGWFAWGLLTIIYLVTTFCNPDYYTKMIILFIGVVAAVLFAFQMLEVLGAEQNIWNSGGFLLFPAAAVFSGWTSLVTYRKKIRASHRDLLLGFPEKTSNS